MLLSSTPINCEYFWEMDAKGLTISPGCPLSCCLRDLQVEKSIGKRSIRRKCFGNRINIKVGIVVVFTEKTKTGLNKKS